MNPFALLSSGVANAGSGAGGGFPFGGSSSSLDSKNQISSGAKNIGGLNFASQNSNLLTIGLIGAVAIAGIYLIKKA